MGSCRENNNIHAEGKSVVVKLLKGKEIAIQLQKLLHKPAVDDDDDDDGPPVSAEELAQQIFRSFSETLSVLSSSCAAAVSIGGGGKKKAAGVKDRRGCYKRRRTSDSWITVSPVMGDGYAWRKYGQKIILNSEYPRCYFRCTNKYDQGCQATKQVQRIKENSVLYQTTYFNHHTCTNHTPITRAPPPLMGSDPVQTSSHSKDDDYDSHCYSTNPMIIMKEESKQESPISEDIKSSLDQWLGFIGSESFGYKPNGAPLMGYYQEEGCNSLGPTSLDGLDMDVNDQFGDIDNFQFDEVF